MDPTNESWFTFVEGVTNLHLAQPHIETIHLLNRLSGDILESSC